MDDTTETLEAPGRFELPNEGFADGNDTATGGHSPEKTGASPRTGGRRRTGEVVAARERSAPHDEAWTRKAALARWGTLAERFWARVNRNGPTMPGMDTPCWEWTGRKDRDGYGRLEADGLSHAKAHRVAWRLVNGPIPEGEVICHHCDNPACVRSEPDGSGHLFPGSQMENIHDSIAKGRHGSLKQAGKKRGPYRRQAA